MIAGRRGFGVRGVVLSGVVGVALVAGLVSPVFAADGERGVGSAVVGSFGVGDSLEVTVDERAGSFRFGLPVGGVHVGWDSASVGGDVYGFGSGWDLGLGLVEVDNGVKMRAASGGLHDPDPTHPSGLAGYGVEDVVFEDAPGVLPARVTGRGVGLPPADEDGIGYRFVLHQLGGVTSYFSAAGDPVARVDGFGRRSVWVWDDRVAHRLRGIVDPDGVVTTLDWESEPGAVVIRPAANLPAEDPDEPDASGVWRVELDGGQVRGLVDPLGGRVSFGYDDATGLLDEVTGVSGATTRVAWGFGDDRVPRVRRVVTSDASGAELSMREWFPGGDGALSSGWPRYADEGEVFWSGDPSFRYQTVVSDGATRVESEYNSQHLLIGRRMVVSTPSGDRELQAQAFTMPGTEEGGVPDPEALPGNWSKANRTEVTYRDLVGGARSQVESYEFDAVGRLVARTTADGTVTTTEYDAVIPDGAKLPVGLPVAETLRAPDGQVRSTRYELNEERTAIIASESHAEGGPEHDGERVLTGRVEHDVDAEGFVTEERVYPQGDRSAVPLVTRQDRVVDVPAGTVTVTETVAAGDPAQATSTTVSSLVHGGALMVADAVGNRAFTEYDLLGRAVRVEDDLGRATTTVHETAQQHGRNAVTSTGADGVAATEVHDPLGRVIEVSDNIDHGVAVPGYRRVAETRAYPEPNLVTVTDAWGATTTSRQDIFGRPVETTSSTGLVQLTVHDDVGNTTTTALTPTGRLADAERTSVESRDVAGHVTERRGARADGREVPTVATEFDGLGRPTGRSDGRVRTGPEFDAFGNPVTTTVEPMAPTARADTDDATVGAVSGSIVATREFDAQGVSLEKTVRDERGSRSGGARTLDALGRTLTETDPAGRVSRYEYTIDGRVSRATAGSGQVTEIVYDDARRLPVRSVVTSPVGEAVRTGYEYHPVTDALVAVFDPDDPDGTAIRTEFDAFGSPTLLRYPGGKTVEFEYDEHGRRIGMTDTAGNVTTLTHTDDGLLATAVQRDARERPLAEAGYEYDVYGRVTTLTRGNGVTTSYAYTSAAEIERETTTDPTGRVLSDRAYEYDVNGNLTQRTDRVAHDADVERTTITSYEYDAHGRLIRSSEHPGEADAPPARDTRYEVSASGDVLTESIDAGGVTTARNFEYGLLRELLAVTTATTGPDGIRTEARHEQTWDVAGNLVHALDGTRYAYDARNRPVVETSADGTVRTTDYWADGSRRRLGTTEPDGVEAVIEFTWVGDQLVNEVHTTVDADALESREGVAAYLLGTGRHARTAFGADGRTGTVYFSADRHGNVTELTDSTGAVTTKYAYSDYGVRTPEAVEEPTGLARNPFGYAGEYTDEVGTQHLSVRTYAPETMRFTTMDTAALHNKYAYADLNPIMQVDPSGREGEPDWVQGVMIGLSFLVGTVLSVATAAATFGLASLAIFAIGMMPTAYSTGLSVIAFMAADHATSHLFSDELKAFVTSGTALLSEIVLTAGAAAAGAAVANAVKSPAQWAQRLAARLAPKPASAPAATSHNVAPKSHVNHLAQLQSEAKKRAARDAKIAEAQRIEAQKQAERQRQARIRAYERAQEESRLEKLETERRAQVDQHFAAWERQVDESFEENWERQFVSIVAYGDTPWGLGSTKVFSLAQDTQRRIFSNGVLKRPDLAKKVQPLLQEILDRSGNDGGRMPTSVLGQNGRGYIEDLNDLLIRAVGKHHISRETMGRLESGLSTYTNRAY